MRDIEDHPADFGDEASADAWGRVRVLALYLALALACGVFDQVAPAGLQSWRWPYVAAITAGVLAWPVREAIRRRRLRAARLQALKDWLARQHDADIVA